MCNLEFLLRDSMDFSQIVAKAVASRCKDENLLMDEESTPTDDVERALKITILSLLQNVAQSKLLRQDDILASIQLFQSRQPKIPQFYRVPVSGKGACLFISLRICLEMGHLNTQIDQGTPPKNFLLDGHNENMLKAGHKLRLTCVEWFKRKLNAPIEQLGSYVQNGRTYVRGDLPALEMVRRGKDVAEEGEQRKETILQYLSEMACPFTWGSSPEYTSVAMMTGKRVNVWQKVGQKLKLIDTVNGSTENSSETESVHEVDVNDEDDEREFEESDFEEIKFVEENDYNEDYNLFFMGGCHYEALITSDHFYKLLANYGKGAISNISPLI